MTIEQNSFTVTFQFERFMELRPFIMEWMHELNKNKIIVPFITDEQWGLCSEMVLVLKPACEITDRMQKEMYVPSDLYGDWLELKLQFELLEHIPLAANILRSMIKREKGIVDTPNMLASVYIDLRMRVLLSDEQKSIALKHLSDVRKRLKIKIQQTAIAAEKKSGSAATSELSKLIKRRRIETAENQNIEDEPFFAIITSAECIEDFDIHPVEYWGFLAKKDPDMHNIISAINSTASAQVSVERAFSAYANILSPRRSNLGNETIDNILIVRLNKGVVEKIRSDIEFD